jgi:hypothetical protein
MEIAASAPLALTYVDCYPSVAGHDANKSYLLFSAPAPNAGTDRNGHRIRLTSPGLLTFRALRLLSSDVCRLKMAGAWQIPLGTSQKILWNRLLSSISGVRPAARASARLNGSRGSNAPRVRAGTNMNTILSAPEHLAAFANTICGKRLHTHLGSTARRLKTAHACSAAAKTLVSRLKTANANFRERSSAHDHSGAVSERMSIRQPVRRAASRAFWPSRPMARDS